MSPPLKMPTVAMRPAHPFRRAVLRGLAVVLPPLLTIVIFVWVGNTVAVYVLDPVESAARSGLAKLHKGQIRNSLADVDPDTGLATDPLTGVVYRRVGRHGRFVPEQVYRIVDESRGKDSMPPTALAVYERYVEVTYLKRYIVLPVFLLVFVFLLYLLGRFLAAGAGRFFWVTAERGIHHLPFVRNVYSSVKQVTDFMLSEREIDYTRVVAVEYPRKGIWSLGFATGDGMRDIRSAANEPVLTVLVPTSPMPFTGYTITVKKSETIDLEMTVDQAFQFIVSCGVVVPPHQIVARGPRPLGDAGDGRADGETKSATLPVYHE